MSNYEDKNKVKELFLIFLLTVATGYFGINGFSILMSIFPAFSIVIGVKYGMKYNLINMILAIMLLSAINGFAYIPALSMYIGLSAILNLGIDKGEKISKVLLKSGTYTFLFLALISVILKVYFNVDIALSLKEALELGLEDTITQLESTGSGYDIVSIKSVMEESINFIADTFPVMLAAGAFTISTISYGIAAYIVRKNDIKHVEVLRLRDFRLSSTFSMASLLILAVVIAIKFMELSIYGPLVSNLTLILYTLVFIQGLGVISYFLSKANVYRVLKFLILGFLAFNPMLSMLVSFAGVVDIVFNFRKIKD